MDDDCLDLEGAESQGYILAADRQRLFRLFHQVGFRTTGQFYRSMQHTSCLLVLCLIHTNHDIIGVLCLLHCLNDHIGSTDAQHGEHTGQVALLCGHHHRRSAEIEIVCPIPDACRQQITIVRVQRISKAMVTNIALSVGIGAALEQGDIQTVAGSVEAI